MRFRKLIRADIQLKLTLWFALLSLFTLVFQFLLMLDTLSGISLEAQNAASQHEMFMDAAARTLLLSVGIVLPLSIIVGVLSTFRIGGPIYRFGEFLKETKSGKRPKDCTLRKNDELQDICRLLNEVTEPLRRPSDSRDEHEDFAA